MSFQWIFDNAETLSINRKKIVGQTVARDGTVRSVVRGPQPRRFDVKVPDGLPWSDFKSSIEAAEALDRYTTDSITIPYAKFPWFYNNVNSGIITCTVICVQFPEWTIFSYNQVGWSGSFIFQEVL